jgi:hypothetical protein
MAFELLNQAESVKGDKTYNIKLYFDKETNRQKHEYVLDEEVLYYLEYDAYSHEVAGSDISIEPIVSGFDSWYDQVGPDWKPQPHASVLNQLTWMVQYSKALSNIQQKISE